MVSKSLIGPAGPNGGCFPGHTGGGSTNFFFLGIASDRPGARSPRRVGCEAEAWQWAIRKHSARSKPPRAGCDHDNKAKLACSFINWKTIWVVMYQDAVSVPDRPRHVRRSSTRARRSGESGCTRRRNPQDQGGAAVSSRSPRRQPSPTPRRFSARRLCGDCSDVD